MKIDMDLIKDILEGLEKSDGKSDFYTPEQLNLDPIEDDVFFFHIDKLRNSNFIEAIIYINLDGYYPTELTWEGQELLNAIRDERVLEQIKKSILSIAGTISLEAIKYQAIEIWKSLPK